MARFPASARKPAIRHVCLAALLAVAVAYQLRFTELTFPRFFGRPEGFDWPFLLLGEFKDPFSVDFLSQQATQAGIHRGDTLVAVNGKPVTGAAVYGEAMAAARVGDIVRITLRSAQPGQGASERTVDLRLQQSNGGGVVTLTLLVVLPFFCIALGFWAAFVRPRDALAWLLLALLLSFSTLPNAAVESWGPGVRDGAAIYHTALSSTLSIWMMLFGIYFPEPFPAGFRRPWWNWLKWALGVPLAVSAVANVIFKVGRLEDYAKIAPFVHALTPAERAFDVCGFLAVSCFFACVATKYHMAVSRDGKRRLRMLYFGALVCFTPLLILLLVAVARHTQVGESFPWWAFLSAYGLMALFPVLLAYLIVVHRAMDVRVVVRQGLQYALATGGIRVVQLVIGIVSGIVVFSVVPKQVGGRSIVFYLVVAAWIALAVRLRAAFRRLKSWTDRRFFRDAYNAEQILSELGDEVRTMFETQPLLATVAARIAESLHVPRVAVLLDGSGPYRTAYAIGYQCLPDVVFPDTGATAQYLGRQREPARVYLDDPNSWVYRTPRLGDEERAQLAALDAELLLPLSVKDKLLGFISLSQKRSEEPYSGADLRLLKSVAAQTGLALENARLTSAIADEVAQRERLNREVEIAREVQERLFPQELPKIPGLDYSGRCRPARGVGGDYYDFLALPGGRLGIALGDVSGKGIAAALMMASLEASLRAEAVRGTDDLATLIQNVNRLVYDATAENHYATFFYAQYNPANRRLSYVNAGHNPPFLLRRCGSERKVERLSDGGTVIGLFPTFPYRQSDLSIEPGDLLVAYTDGITETMNQAEEEWGETELIRTVEASNSLPTAEVIDRIMSAADRFASGAKQHDDMTLVVLRLL